MFSAPFLDLPPLHRAAGMVRLPGSKSISNRALLLAGLSAGTTVLHGVLHSDDTQVMLAALRELGCGVVAADDGAIGITGFGAQGPSPEAKLFLGNAGTAMRPLTAALALLAAARGGRYELAGVERMHERPIGDLVSALRALGCELRYLGHDGYPPLVTSGPRALRLDTPIRVRGDVSSQFLTALLLALPLASGPRAITVEVEGELISKPYVEITLALLARFGIAVRREGWQRFTIPADSAYRSPGELRVEGDASSASYFVAMGAIAAVDAPLRIEGVGSDSVQGDIRFVDAARAMGADVTLGPGWIEARRGAWPLKALTLDCNPIPDAAMTLAVMALYADGPCRLTHIASWRVKETDRIAAMATELCKLGAVVVEGDDFIEVTPPHMAAGWQPAAIATYDDHRMAMCGSLAAFGGVAVRILDPRCVGKTYPDYFEALFSVATARPDDVPVLTVDGPTASGKGTLASALAHALGYHLLDSGSLYRVTALAALRAGTDPTDGPALAALAHGMRLKFAGERLHLNGEDVTELLRLEAVGSLASRISALPPVRQALHGLQLAFREAPGLVADGRDMGTVLFPQARLKVFLTASPAMRADRRHKQLISKGISANIEDLRADLEARDVRDKSRSVSPLKPAEDAQLLDNSGLTVDQSVAVVLGWWSERSPFGGPPAAAQAARAADSTT